MIDYPQDPISKTNREHILLRTHSMIDYHQRPPLVPVTAAENGRIRTPVGCTIPLLIN
jgi:hypothetical protein